MSNKIYVACVRDEFQPYQAGLRAALTRRNCEASFLEDLVAQDGDTLALLDRTIADCDSVLHLVGDMTGDHPPVRHVDGLRDRHPDFNTHFHNLADTIDAGAEIPYTQWAAWLALYHHKPLHIAQAHQDARRAPQYLHSLAQTAHQAAHLHHLVHRHHRPGIEFRTASQLFDFATRSAMAQHTTTARSAASVLLSVVGGVFTVLALVWLLRGYFVPG